MEMNAIIRNVSREYAKKFPVTWNRVIKKRYELPQYRQADYYNQDALNAFFMDYFVTRYKVRVDLADTPNKVGWALECLALHHDRPTFYLERELGEALVRTEIPGDFSSEDIH
jgi:hypothetical protein